MRERNMSISDIVNAHGKNCQVELYRSIGIGEHFPDHFHTDNCVDAGSPDLFRKRDMILWEVLDEEEYDRTFLANTSFSFSDLYMEGDKVLAIMVPADTDDVRYRTREGAPSDRLGSCSDYEWDASDVIKNAAEFGMTTEEFVNEFLEMAEEEEIHDWIIGKSGSAWDDVETERVRGTRNDVKRYLLSLVQRSRDIYMQEEGEDWENGTEKISQITENAQGRLYAYACFSDSHEDYTAEMDSGKIRIL